jgi:hypothetical protein
LLSCFNREHNPKDRSNILIERNYGYLLFPSIEKAKYELSNSYGAKITFGEYGMAINEDINQKEFDGFIEAKVNRIQATIGNLRGFTPGLLKKVNRYPPDAPPLR